MHTKYKIQTFDRSVIRVQSLWLCAVVWATRCEGFTKLICAARERSKETNRPQHYFSQSNLIILDLSATGHVLDARPTPVSECALSSANYRPTSAQQHLKLGIFFLRLQTPYFTYTVRVNADVSAADNLVDKYTVSQKKHPRRF